MSDDRRLKRPREYARENFPRDREGRLVAPYVRRSRPRAGDIHPLEIKPLRALLARQPIEALYGLKGIALKPRRGAVGDPFGLYRPSEKLIVLYSVPMVWPVRSRDEADCWVPLGATYEEDRKGARLVWKRPEDLARWYYGGVLLHELGHHFSFQWKRRRKTPLDRTYQEVIADVRARKLWRRFRVRFRS